MTKTFNTLAACLAWAGTAGALETGAAAPQCKLTHFADQAPLDTSRYLGKVVYLDFWASWCGPCAESMPFLSDMQAQLGGKGLEVVGVNLDEERGEAERFLQKYPVGFTVAADPESLCPNLFEVQAMPSSYLIDRKGKIRHVQLGFRDSERAEIRRKIEHLLAEKQ